jgi:hypothetical protein
MTTSPLSDNAVLNLFAPKVNGRTLPVFGADIGVPLVAYDLVTDGKGAYVVIDPPLSGTVNPNDVITLWLGSEPALLDSETILDPNAITTLRIPKGRLHPDRINSIHYTVTRGSSNIGTSPSLEILYNRIRPGLKDRYDAPGGHSELKLLLPDAIRNGVGADFVSASVCASYPYCRAYDCITLKCNGELMTANVNPNQAPQPPNPGSEIPITICFTVGRAYLERAKRLDQKLHFSYTVTDQIRNGPDTDAPWSPVQTVDEDLDGTHLTMPILLERMQDYPGDDPSIIDLEKLGGNPLLLIIVTVDNRFEVGHDVVATYTATSTGQPADVVVTVSGKIEADAFGQKKPCILEIANNKVFPDSSVSVTYELFKPNGERVGKSIPAKGQVTGQAPIVLLPPILLPPAVSPFDVLAYVNGLTLQIEYLLAITGDKAQLAEINPPAGAVPFPLVEFDGSKRVNTVLPVAFLAARHGKAIEFYWVLNRNSAPIAKSAELKLQVLSIAPGDARLPIPNIAGETGKQLDVHKLNNNDSIQVAKWSFQEKDQNIWLDLDGVDASDNIASRVIRNGERHDSAEGLIIQAPKDWLQGLKDGSEMKIKFSVNPEKDADRTKAIMFAERVYLISAIVFIIPTISRVTDSAGNAIELNGRTFDTVVNLEGFATKNLQVEIFDNGNSMGLRPVNNEGRWTSPALNLTTGGHVFTAKARYENEPISQSWTITVYPTLVYETTTFEDGTFGGWISGPAASDRRDLSIRLEQGNRRIFNNTYTNNSAGIVLRKTFPNFKIGQRYQFSITAITRYIGGTPNPGILSLSTSNEQITSPTTLPRTWVSLSGIFTATSNSMELRVNSHQATHDGNDYEMDNFTIRAI